MELTTKIRASWNDRHKEISKRRIEDSEVRHATLLLSLRHCIILCLLNLEMDVACLRHVNLHVKSP